MKKSILLLMLVASLLGLLASCNPCLYMSKHCPKVVRDSVVVVEKDSLVKKDSVVIVPRDSFRIILKDSVPCKDFKATQKDSKGNKVTVEVKDGKMTVDAQCEDAKVKLEWFEHHYKKIISNYHSEVYTVTKKGDKTAFQRFKTIWFWVTSILLLILIVLWILRKVGKLPITINQSG